MNDTQTTNNSTATKIVNALRWVGAAILPIITVIITGFAFMLIEALDCRLFNRTPDKLGQLFRCIISGCTIPPVAYCLAPRHKRMACVIISTIYATIYGIDIINRASLRDWWGMAIEISLMVGVVFSAAITFNKTKQQ